MISVCVPYWRRQPELDAMFRMYARLYPDLPIEFSVCDDGSPEPARVPDGVVLTRLRTKREALNPCVPINRAVAASSGDLIVLTNPEVEHVGPVLSEMLSLLCDPSDYVTARCRHRGKGRSGNADGLWLAGPDTTYHTNGREPVPPGGHFHFLALMHRDLWERAGGFDEDYRAGSACDDNDWLWRLYEAGASFRTTEGMVWHSRREQTNWARPHNRQLFARKWPAERRRELVERREGVTA